MITGMPNYGSVPPSNNVGPSLDLSGTRSMRRALRNQRTTYLGKGARNTNGGETPIARLKRLNRAKSRRTFNPANFNMLKVRGESVDINKIFERALVETNIGGSVAVTAPIAPIAQKPHRDSMEPTPLTRKNYHPKKEQTPLRAAKWANRGAFGG